MADLNSITITGRLTKDAEIVTLASGKSVMNLSVACNIGFGQYAQTIFYKVQQWLNNADNKLKPYLLKGALIGCTGEHNINTYTTQAGETRAENVIKTFGIQILKFVDKQETGESVTEAVSTEPDIPSF